MEPREEAARSASSSGGGALYLVATPIGNLADITLRAIEVLAAVDLILAEDTRTSARLLARHRITTPMASCHEHNERARCAEMVGRIRRGASIALISDAGTPLLSDPGFPLVEACIAAGVPVHPIPGASSLLAALAASGLPPYPFTFLGFLPRKGRDRRRRIEEIVACRHTVVVLESARRVGATLEELLRAGGGGLQAVLARELTKLHEEFVRDSLEGLARQVAQRPPRGEVVLLFAPDPELGAEVDDETIIAALADSGLRDHSASARARAVARRLGVDKQRVYHLIHRAR
ncbi:MAG: 16S rRNA (cytidine(1402)-2'-O)-methyltransferase [Zetaproteobacteria bacterium]|nr:MAG: 16S rRNA (cytidine(1402)-2'-O)-methyltransferase [Zetaproteobacteria bacterium]